jgi:hypothetical protein
MSISRSPLDANYVRSILEYNPDTGIFIWKYRNDVSAHWNAQFAGHIAGCVSKRDGYTQICINNKTYYASRLALLMVHGEWPDPDKLLDHKSVARDDNRRNSLKVCVP